MLLLDIPAGDGSGEAQAEERVDVFEAPLRDAGGAEPVALLKRGTHNGR